jgi:hypothetical protein
MKNKSKIPEDKWCYYSGMPNAKWWDMYTYTENEKIDD